ncbi:MAG: hypothetical protein IPK60_22885 [Sandaracinaceae bacterium]|nr:hypothetical protein [Sandaracinaceae bacterium]
MLERVATNQTIKQVREGARVIASRIVASIPSLAGVSYTAIGESLGINHQRASKMADPQYASVNITVADVLCIPPLARAVVVRALAHESGGEFIPWPDTNETNRDLRLIASLQRESSEVVATLLDACANGHVSVSEAAAIRKETEGLLTRAFEILRLCDVVEEKRGLGLTR